MTMHETIAEAVRKLDGAAGEVTLDLSSVRRISSGDLVALESLAAEAAAKSVKLAFHGVDVNVYRVFKAAKLRSF